MTAKKRKQRPLYYEPPTYFMIPGVPLRRLTADEFDALPDHLRRLAARYYEPVYRSNGGETDNGGND